MNGPTRSRTVRIDALAVIDAAGVRASPGTLLLNLADGAGAAGPGLRTIAAGPTAALAGHEAAQAPSTLLFRRPHSVLIPGLVNAHTHLDLTHIGPQPHELGTGFVTWVDMVRARRHHDDDAIEASVRRGVELSRAAGVLAVGDIAGAPGGRITFAPWRALARGGLRGVSFLEFFGIGRGEARALDALARLRPDLERTLGEAPTSATIGLQPHAPNTVSRRVYSAAAALAAEFTPPLRLSTHLAETPEEREFVGSAQGGQRALLERLQVWDDAILNDLGHGLHPVAHLEPVLASARYLVAHVNDADDAALEILARTSTAVAYCPRASAYFGAHDRFGPHRYQDMLARGIPVALGTDSVINLPPGSERTRTETPTGRGMSIFDEMQFLFRCDGTDPVVLLRMGTIAGAAALGLDPKAFTFDAGAPLAGVAEINVGPEPAGDARELLGRTLRRADVGCSLLLDAKSSSLAGTAESNASA